jgi:VanZ family protein
MLLAHLIYGGRLPGDNIFGKDKLLHIAEYIVFSFLFINAIERPNIRKIAIIIFIGACFGALIEILQLYVSGRYADFYDGVANVIGLLIGSVITYKYLLIDNDKEAIH